MNATVHHLPIPAELPAARVVHVPACRFVTIELAAVMTGLSEHAIRNKIHKGVWLEDRQYRRAADGRVYIDIEGYEQWVERGQA